MVVIKRDGRVAQFDKSKIVNAVLKAFAEVDDVVTPYAKGKGPWCWDQTSGAFGCERRRWDIGEEVDPPSSVCTIQKLAENKLKTVMAISDYCVFRTFLSDATPGFLTVYLT